MPIAINTPRINNNDDFVRFSHIITPPGTSVRKGDPVAEIETDKATFTIEAEDDGYILGFVQPVGEMIPVGSVLAWLGSSRTDAIPQRAEDRKDATSVGEPTLKAAILLARFGLSASEIPAQGERLVAADVVNFIERRNLRTSSERRSHEAQPGPGTGLAAGDRVPLSVSGRAMLKNVLWHSQSAVPGYVEIDYETQAWDQYAHAFQRRYNLLLSPALPLMAWRLVQLAVENPTVNSTILNDELYKYRTVNLGFTLQSQTQLSLLSVRDAGRLGARDFVEKLSSLMRQGMKEKLAPEDTTEVTISFSSMSRWQVIRHMPVLPPYTSLIIAHSFGRHGIASLGSTYDHRVLTGGEVAVVLRSLSIPPAD